MNETTSTLNWMALAAQLGPFLHLALACLATAVVLRRRRALSAGLALTALLLAWLIPVLGPLSVLWGLRGSAAIQS